MIIIGSNNKNILNQYNIKSFYYITHIENLNSILEKGIFCKNLMEDKSHKDISNGAVQRKRNGWHNYVPLFFADNTPMLYCVIKSYKNNIILLEIDKDIAFEKNMRFSDGNIACGGTKIYDKLDDLEQLDWSIIFNRKPACSKEWKRKRSAELLIPDKMNVSYISNIHVQEKEQFLMVENTLKKHNLDKKINIANDLTEQGYR